MRAFKTIRNTAIAVFLLLNLFLGIGLAYVLISDDSTDKKAAQSPNPTPPPAAPKPSKPNPNNPVSASVVSLTTPVTPGSNSSITIKSTATATCSIQVVRDESDGKITVEDSGLTEKTADQFGNVTWSWTMDKSAPVGSWKVKVTCKYGKKSGYVEGTLLVVKKI